MGGKASVVYKTHVKNKIFLFLIPIKTIFKLAENLKIYFQEIMAFSLILEFIF